MFFPSYKIYWYLMLCVHCFVSGKCDRGRSQWPCSLRRGSWPVGCWDRGFESRSRLGCLSASSCFVLSCVGRGLATDWSLVQGVLPYVGFEVLTGVSMKISVFWVVAPHRPDDGGSKDLWNVVKLLPDYTVLQPRRQQSSVLPYV
jgi:hypothetical protein